MDQKTTTALDPKLKEVYDRVMGTSSQPSAPITPTPIQSGSTAQIPLTPTSPMPASALIPTTPPSSSIGLTPPMTSASPINPVTPIKNTLPPLPEKPLTPPASLSGSAPLATTPEAPKPTVDYAAIAAKYATPLPTMNASATSLPPRPNSQATVTPSTTTYGVVNGGNSSTTKVQAAHTEKSGSSLKKILLIIGIPLFIVAYTAVWIVVFKVDLMSVLPLPK